MVVSFQNGTSKKTCTKGSQGQGADYKTNNCCTQAHFLKVCHQYVECVAIC